MKRNIIAGALAVMLALSTTVLAASTQKQITVDANQMKVVVDGKNMTADNFLYNGTTYLPLRAISEAVGATVAYDDKTQTATITSSGTSREATMNATTADVYDELFYTSQKLFDLLDNFNYVVYFSNNLTKTERESKIDSLAEYAITLKEDVEKQEARIAKYEAKNSFYTTSFVESTGIISNFNKALDMFSNLATKTKIYMNDNTDANYQAMADVYSNISDINNKSVYYNCQTQHDKFMVRITE